MKKYFNGIAATVAIGLMSFASSASATNVLHYDFSSGSGTNVTDLSGSGNDGTLVDFGDTSAGAGAYASSEGWVSGGGLSFLDDGVRNHVTTPVSSGSVMLGVADDQDFTVEYLASAADPEGWTPAVGTEQNGFSQDGTYFFGIDSGLTHNAYRIPSPGAGGNGGGSLGLQPWTLGAGNTEVVHHIAVVWDSATDTATSYIDGVVGDTMGYVIDFGLFASTNFRVGNTGHSDGEQWDGILYGVAISTEALSPQTFVLQQIPEPSTLAMLFIGMSSVMFRRRK